MPGSKSDYLEKAVLDQWLGGVAPTVPGTVYLALSSAVYSDAGLTSELVGGGYARVALTNNTTNFPAATGTSPTTKKQAVAGTFPTASADQGTAQSFYYMDAASGGNALYGGPLDTNKAINNGDTASIPANGVTVTED